MSNTDEVKEDTKLTNTVQTIGSNSASVEGTGNMVATNVVYALRSVSSGNYLDGRTKDKNPYMTNRNPKDDPVLHWIVIKVNTGYALKGVKSGNYLDGRSDSKSPKMTNRDPTNDKFLQWTFQVCDDNTIAIKSVSSGNYLDGRTKDKDPWLTNRDPTSDAFLQWRFQPQDAELTSIISDFDFGDDDTVQKLLDDNKQVAFNDKKSISVGKDAIGITVHGEYGEEMTSTFSFGFTESIGVGVSTSVEAGVPLVAKATTEVSGSFTFESTQNWATTTTQNFITGYSFTPSSEGDFVIGLIVYVVRNVALPFTAKVTATATNEKGEKYSGIVVSSFYTNSGSNCEVLKIGDDYVDLKITGTMTASYGVESHAYSKKVS